MTIQAGRCPRCGVAVRDGERFCGECGLPLAAGSAPVPPPAPAPHAAPSGQPAGTAARRNLAGALLVAAIMAGCYFAWTRWLQPHGAAPGAAPPAAEAASDSVPAAPTAAARGTNQPLVSDEAVRWSEANSFDRYQAGQQLVEGERYLSGEGVPVDYERARNALEAAAQYEGRAAFHLFEIYGQGLGVVPDIRVSFQWLNRAAGLADAQGQYVLARFYYDGFSDFLAPDPVTAERWMRASAAQGYEPAQAFLAEHGLIR